MNTNAKRTLARKVRCPGCGFATTVRGLGPHRGSAACRRRVAAQKPTTHGSPTEKSATPAAPARSAVPPIEVRARGVMLEAIRSGISHGWHRAHEHTDAPTPEKIQEAMEQAIEAAIDDKFRFKGEEQVF